MSVLTEIQGKLKAPKGQVNKFGNYKYRSCEDIVEAVKPLLVEHDAHLLLSDEIVMLGERYYVKATAAIVCGADRFEVTGWAREAAIKKGMDESQITGAASSYARKYALNGLLAIDDTKDADTMDNSKTDHLADALAYLNEADSLETLHSHWEQLTADQRKAVGKTRLESIKSKLGAK